MRQGLAYSPVEHCRGRRVISNPEIRPAAERFQNPASGAVASRGSGTPAWRWAAPSCGKRHRGDSGSQDNPQERVAEESQWPACAGDRRQQGNSHSVAPAGIRFSVRGRAPRFRAPARYASGALPGAGFCGHSGRRSRFDQAHPARHRGRAGAQAQQETGGCSDRRGGSSRDGLDCPLPHSDGRDTRREGLRARQVWSSSLPEDRHQTALQEVAVAFPMCRLGIHAPSLDAGGGPPLWLRLLSSLHSPALLGREAGWWPPSLYTTTCSAGSRSSA